MSKEKVVLAYSGGLDTSVCVKWLQDEKNLDVVCVCGNVGQEETGLDAKKQKALDLGVLDCQVLDLRDEETIWATNRFMIYALFAQANISVLVIWGLHKQNTVFGVGRSILNRTSNTHIGNLMLEFGGGGQAGAGTCQVANEKADLILKTLIQRINADG